MQSVERARAFDDVLRPVGGSGGIRTASTSKPSDSRSNSLRVPSAASVSSAGVAMLSSGACATCTSARRDSPRPKPLAAVASASPGSWPLRRWRHRNFAPSSEARSASSVYGRASRDFAIVAGGAFSNDANAVTLRVNIILMSSSFSTCSIHEIAPRHVCVAPGPVLQLT